MNLVAIGVADYIGFILLVAMLVSSKIRRAAPRDEFKLFTIIAFLSAIACVVDYFVFFSFFCFGIVFLIFVFISCTSRITSINYCIKCTSSC